LADGRALLPLSYLALAGAAAVGSKRLSSDTYKLLNLSSIAVTITQMLQLVHDKNYLIAALGLHELIVSLVGLVRGVTYKPS
jgi:hypothetical protein